MPTNKKRVTITITGQIERDLNIIWTAYPNLQGSEVETIAFILTLKASEIQTGQAIVPKKSPSIAEEIAFNSPQAIDSTPGGEDDPTSEEWTD